MPQILNQAGDCCDRNCLDPEVVNIPGPKGDPAAPCVPCEDGQNAFTDVALAFVQPGVGGTVAVEVDSTATFSSGQVIFIEGGGYYLINFISSSTTWTLENLGYDANSPPGTVIPASAHVSPAGEKGADGTAAGGFLLAANNLNDVANTATSRNNLGLGALALLNTVNTAQVDNLAITDAKLATVLDLSGKTINYPANSIGYTDVDQVIRDFLPAACAMVSITAGVVVVDANFNILSITQNGAGRYDVVFGTALPANDYLITFGVASTVGGQNFVVSYANKVVSGFSILTASTVGAVPVAADTLELSFVVIRIT